MTMAASSTELTSPLFATPVVTKICETYRSHR